jgi:hypothetical protein
MADNVGYTPGSGATVAADDIGGVLHQRIKIGVGADGSATDVSSANPLPVSAIDPSVETAFGPITAANTVLFAAVNTENERTIVLQLSGNFLGGVSFQASQNSTDWFDAQGFSWNNQIAPVSTVYAPDVINIPVTARFFRAITTSDFGGSVSGSYSLRTIDAPALQNQTTLVDVGSDVIVPVGGADPNGYHKKLSLSEAGYMIPADGRVITGTRSGAQVGPIVQLDTTGYGTVILQLAGTFTGTVTFQLSNDASTWSNATAWPVAGAAVPVSTATAVGQWIIPAAGRFFRAQITTAGTGQPLAVAVLKNFGAMFPSNIPQQNVQQIGGTATVTAGVAGMLAVGGNIAEDTAATSNPLICGGVVRTALPASTVSAGDAIRETYSTSGQLIIKPFAPGDLDFFVNATVTTATQTALRAAQAAGIRTNVTGITYQNTNATATTLTIQDGATTLITFNVPASMTQPSQLTFQSPLRGTAATALNYTAGTTGASVLLNVTGFSSY